MKRTPYQLTLESRVPDAQPKYRFDTADGVCSKREFRDAELLLVESLWDVDLGRLLVVEANYGVVPIVLAERARSVRMAESSARATRLCERNAAANDVNATATLVADVTTIDGLFDSVAYAPKPFVPISVGKQRIADALSLVPPGGSVYLAASKQAGLTRYEECLDEIAGTVREIASAGSYSLLEATRPQPFDPPTYVSPRAIAPEIDDTTLSLVTTPGLFSADSLDDGTRLLLENVTVEENDRVLDLCCGYGAIGTYAGRTADCDVWLSDDDRLATACAERSLSASGVEGTVVTADCVDGVSDRTFDRVFCNPPTHAGRDVLRELFTGVHDVLAPGGELTLVHHRALDLHAHLEQFDSIERIQTGDEHVVLRN